MDPRDSVAQAAFRQELRTWLAAVLPVLPAEPDRHDWAGRRAYDTAWQRALSEAGYAGVHWPAEYGGRGATPTEHLIFLEETELAGAPYVGVNFVGLLHAGPTLIAEGSPEQRARHLPAILRGDEVWCQGFSEPDAGSDLAALRTRAELDGDHYVVSGRKIWTSHAQVADYCELLVRTDPAALREGRKHTGITWLILPMDTPGIEIRPLRTIAGSTEFSELVLDEVRVPVANRVGAVGDGWRVAMVTFSFERGTAFVSEVVAARRQLDRIRTLIKESGLWNTWAEHQWSALSAEFDALWALVRLNVSEAEHSASGVPGPGASVFKLRFSEARQRLYEFAGEALGRRTAVSPEARELTGQRLNSLSYTIAAGTSQIQRNIIAERLLGLPKGAR